MSVNDEYLNSFAEDAEDIEAPEFILEPGQVTRSRFEPHLGEEGSDEMFGVFVDGGAEDMSTETMLDLGY